MDRHHLVPQMYLRLFADASKNLIMVDRNDLTKSHNATVRRACAEAGFYTIPTEDIEPDARAGHDPDALEKSFSNIEGNTAPVIDKLITAHKTPTIDDLTVLNGVEGPGTGISGPKGVADGLDQLLSYLVWRDSKAALIIFIKTADRAATIERLHDAVKAHPRYTLTKEAANPSSRVDYIVTADDEGRRVSLAVIPVVIRSANS